MVADIRQLAIDLFLYQFHLDHADSPLIMPLVDGTLPRTSSEGHSIDAAFHRFNIENPHVMLLFVGFAFQLLLHGRGGSAKLIFERMRWEYLLTTTDTDFKLNNNYSSRFARLAMERYPSLRGFFELRVLHENRQL